MEKLLIVSPKIHRKVKNNCVVFERGTLLGDMVKDNNESGLKELNIKNPGKPELVLALPCALP